MKILDRFISFIFTLVVMILAVVVFMEAIDMIGYTTVDNALREYVFVEDAKYKVFVIMTSALVFLLGFKVTVFTSELSGKTKKNITVNTGHGKIQIAQETIEAIATSVIKNHSQVKDVQARMVKANKGINMYMILTVYENTRIKELVNAIQEEVKNQIELTTNVNVFNVDVKIRNISTSSSGSNLFEQKKDKEVNVSVTEEPESVEKEKVGKNEIRTDGYLVDENNVLYKVEPNLNANVDAIREEAKKLEEENK